MLRNNFVLVKPTTPLVSIHTFCFFRHRVNGSLEEDISFPSLIYSLTCRVTPGVPPFTALAADLSTLRRRLP